MSDFKPRPGSFTAYLEYAQRDTRSGPRAAASPLMLPLADLETLSGMEPARYRAALKSLRDEGYLAIEGARLARPA